MLDPVPFRCAGRVVADGDLESRLGGEPGEFGLLQPDPVSVRSSTVGGDQQSGRASEAVAAHRVPPRADRVDRELGGVSDITNRDPSLVVSFVVDPVRDRPTEFGIDEVVDIDGSARGGGEWMIRV